MLIRHIIKIALMFAAGSALANDKVIVPDVIEVSAGPFVMGSLKSERERAYQLDEKAYGHKRTREWGWYDNEKRSTPVLPSFAITRTPITNRQYQSFVKSTGWNSPGVSQAEWKSYGLIHPYSRTRRHAWSAFTYPSNRDEHPVVLVGKSDAEQYAGWLSLKTGYKWRLPTEQEWEKAARGTDGRSFPWGNDFNPAYLNSHDNGPFDTMPVGQYKSGASPYGLLDAAGHVFEWTSTAAGEDRFIVKGGSWDDRGCGVCRPAARHSRPASLKHILIGFRLVRVNRQ